jgi:glycosyltransferase involved in cell wall biosynthesis
VLLSATLIVRDEAKVLEDCLDSIRDVVDEIVVVDTGSVDGSADIARRLGARVIHHPWKHDFAEARNVGLDAAQGEWILYIDADERLSATDRAAVERLLTGRPEVAFRLLLRPDLRSTPYREYRLWRGDPRIRFRGQIHEKVTPAIAAVSRADRRPIGDCELQLTHVGYEGSQVHKHARNLPLLRAELSREPDNLFNRHHLARVLQGLGHDEEAALVLGDAVELSRRRPSDPLGVLVLTDLVRLRRARDEDVSDLLSEARRRYPDNKLLWWVEAAVAMSDGRYAEALELLDRLLAVDLAMLPNEGVAYDERIFGEFTHEARGTCLFRMERYAEAAEAYDHAALADPSNLTYRAKREVARGRAGAPGASQPRAGAPGASAPRAAAPGASAPRAAADAQQPSAPGMPV